MKNIFLLIMLGLFIAGCNASDKSNPEKDKPIVNDITKPIIKLLGSSHITLQQGTAYHDAGAIATDDTDGNISSVIQVNNPVDSNHIGTYLITYNVKDKANNHAIQVTRTVYIVKASDTTKPIISLLGKTTVTVERTTNYNDMGATAIDDTDGDISSAIQVNNPVDTDHIGTYLVTFNVKDAANNSADQVTRSVIVVDTIAPLKPTLSTIPTETSRDTQTIILKGEAGATIWINGIQKGVIANNGEQSIDLDTSGADGIKYFSIVLQDASANSSSPLILNIIKSSIDPLFNEFHVGFGGSSSFPFSSTTAGEKIYVSARSLVLDDDIGNNASYAKIKYFDAAKFSTLHNYLKKSKFITFWFVDGWQESWYNIPSIQALMDAGYIPVFNYWYFGDKLITGMPDSAKQDAYALDNIKVANFLEKLKGKKILIMEPEFNKQPVLASADTQHEFASIISYAIDTIKTQNPELLVSLSMMDTGSRGVTNTDSKCGYANCALGDVYAWEKPQIVFNDLLDKLDFISFHQMIGQFSRDYNNPGGWNTPNPRKFTDEELGIDFLAERVANFSKFLHDKYNKPIYLPYIAIMTATWDADSNNNQQIEDNEISYNGWQEKANHTYKRLAELKTTLKENGLFGFSPMALFDNPRQDYGGYQYFINNEYHLGIIGSSAIDEDDIAPYGDLQFKGTVLESIFNIAD
ncbi:MAG: hypothetical protein DSZ29_01480 [Aquificaceae bacterium]|nr:MAG: hypothetical protein DSZ29_01480 [Aquificaceae bacterium]